MPRVGTPTPLDGKGRATISPDVVRAGEQISDYTVTFTAGPQGIEEGGQIHLVYPSEIISYGNEYRVLVPFLATDSLIWFMRAHIEAKADGGARLEVGSTPPWAGWTHKLRLVMGFYKSLWSQGTPTYTVRELAREMVKHTITIDEGRIDPQEEITITIVGTHGRAPLQAPRYANWTSLAIYVDGDGDGIALPLSSSPRIITTGRKATAFRVVATAVPKTWEKIRVVVCAVDDDGQVDPIYTGTVYLDAPSVALPGRTEFRSSDLGRKVFVTRTPVEGVYFIVARDQAGRRGRSNPMVVEERGLHLYWGDPHLHSVLGIGNNIPEWVLRTARDDLALDFASITLFNHRVPFNNHLKYLGIGQSSFAWGHIQRITNTFDRPGKFAVINGFEWGNNRLGHRNIYYSPEDSDIKLLSHIQGNTDTVDELHRALKGHKAISAPHHTAWRGGEFMGRKYDWGPNDDTVQRLIEVYSSHGASEYHDNPFPIHARNPIEDVIGPGDQAGRRSGAFVRDVLARGYKLGMIAGGDRRFDMDRPEPYPGGLTAVWAKSLSAHHIWNSLYSRRCYATTGARIFIRWTVGGAGPGSELAVDVPLDIRLNIVGTAPIKEAQIIRYENDYRISKSFKSHTEILRIDWQDNDPPRRGFYFLRVLQEDGHMAWAGPIWVYQR